MTPQERELMQQALDALNRSDCLGWQFNIPLIKALRARLAQSEQGRPCDGNFPEGFNESYGIPAQALRAANAIMFDVIGERNWDVPCTAKHLLAFASNYTALPQSKTKQEPVAWRHWLQVDGEQFPQLTLVPRTDKDDPLYTAPPQREWQGLTDEEQGEVAWSCGAMSADWLDFARAIEAKLREKNL